MYDAKNKAYSSFERKEAQSAFEDADNELSTLENFTDIISMSSFRRAMQRYFDGNREYRYSDSENLDMIGADVSDVYEELPELSDLINRQNAQTRGRVYSDASIRSAAAEILEAASAAVPEAKRGELEIMLRDAFVNWSRRGISAEEFMEQARNGKRIAYNRFQVDVQLRNTYHINHHLILGVLLWILFKVLSK